MIAKQAPMTATFWVISFHVLLNNNLGTKRRNSWGLESSLVLHIGIISLNGALSVTDDLTIIISNNLIEIRFRFSISLGLGLYANGISLWVKKAMVLELLTVGFVLLELQHLLAILFHHGSSFSVGSLTIFHELLQAFDGPFLLQLLGGKLFWSLEHSESVNSSGLFVFADFFWCLEGIDYVHFTDNRIFFLLLGLSSLSFKSLYKVDELFSHEVVCHLYFKIQ